MRGRKWADRLGAELEGRQRADHLGGGREILNFGFWILRQEKKEKLEEGEVRFEISEDRRQRADLGGARTWRGRDVCSTGAGETPAVHGGGGVGAELEVGIGIWLTLWEDWLGCGH